MDKEELKREANKLYEDWYAHKLGAISIIDVICKIAEPREKRIEELEKETEKLKIQNTNANLKGLEMQVAEDSHRDRAKKAYSQLRKANELLKKWVDLFGYKANFLTEQTKQLLRDCDIDRAIQCANEGLDFDKIAEEIEQDLKDSKI